MAIPLVLGLALAGLRVTDATRSARAYGQVVRLAVLGQRVTGLAQAMEDERAATAAFLADGRPAAALVALHRQYAITDRWAATVRRQVLQLGRGYPAQTRASAATVLTSIAELPALRWHAAQRDASPLGMISGYSAATAGLFPVNDSIADAGGDSALISSVRALGSLSRMTDQAAQQQAILGAALAAGHFGPGALTALSVAQAQQASDLASFRGSATPEESWALTGILAGRQARQAQAVEQRAAASRQRRAGPRGPGQPAVAGRNVLHGGLDAPLRAAAGDLDNGLRPGPAARRDAVGDDHRRRGAGHLDPGPAGHRDHRQFPGALAATA